MNSLEDKDNQIIYPKYIFVSSFPGLEKKKKRKGRLKIWKKIYLQLITSQLRAIAVLSLHRIACNNI